MAYTSPLFSNNPSSFGMRITREEFHSFHKIDRDLFTCLVFALKRDMEQSSQVIAFLLTVEQLGFARNLIAYLVSLQDMVISAVADEVIVCLNMLYNQDYASYVFLNHKDKDEVVIPYLKNITDSKLTLGYIIQYRNDLLVGVKKNLNDVCNRAFDDIYEKCYREQMLALERAKVIEEMEKIRVSALQQNSSRFSVQRRTPSWWNVEQPIPIRSTVQHGNRNRSSVRQGTYVRVSAPQERVSAPAVKEEAKAAVGADNKEDEEEVTPADDRTVFLTFSKGYPISESEVRVFFTRTFGDVIEDIVMKEMKENVQPLFARMVLKMQYASKIDEIVTPQNKQKFIINGKHVLARKYIR